MCTVLSNVKKRFCCRGYPQQNLTGNHDSNRKVVNCTVFQNGAAVHGEKFNLNDQADQITGVSNVRKYCSEIEFMFLLRIENRFENHTGDGIKYGSGQNRK